MMRMGIVILAAGGSQRMGEPKQLLPHQGKTLLRHVVDESLALRPAALAVVLGAQAERISVELRDTPALPVFNPRWQEGMGSSIRAGVSALLERDSGLDRLLLAVCDQPFVSAALFGQLIAASAESGKGIAACAYAGTHGTPVIFSPPYYAALLSLDGDRGAKSLLRAHADDIASVAFELGAMDIDTPDDYRRLTPHS